MALKRCIENGCKEFIKCDPPKWLGKKSQDIYECREHTGVLHACIDESDECPYEHNGWICGLTGRKSEVKRLSNIVASDIDYNKKLCNAQKAYKREHCRINEKYTPGQFRDWIISHVGEAEHAGRDNVESCITALYTMFSAFMHEATCERRQDMNVVMDGLDALFNECLRVMKAAVKKNKKNKKPGEKRPREEVGDDDDIILERGRCSDIPLRGLEEKLNSVALLVKQNYYHDTPLPPLIDKCTIKRRKLMLGSNSR